MVKLKKILLCQGKNLNEHVDDLIHDQVDEKTFNEIRIINKLKNKSLYFLLSNLK